MLVLDKSAFMEEKLSFMEKRWLLETDCFFVVGENVMSNDIIINVNNK